MLNLNKFKYFSNALTLIVSCLLSFSAQAHFQMLYTPDLLHAKSGAISFKMPFTHPAASGHVMKINKLESFYMIKKGKKTDLMNTVSEIEWESAVDKGKAYQADVRLRGLGDYVFIAQPSNIWSPSNSNDPSGKNLFAEVILSQFNIIVHSFQL